MTYKQSFKASKMKVRLSEDLTRWQNDKCKQISHHESEGRDYLSWEGKEYDQEGMLRGPEETALCSWAQW